MGAGEALLWSTVSFVFLVGLFWIVARIVSALTGYSAYTKKKKHPGLWFEAPLLLGAWLSLFLLWLVCG